MLNAGLLQAVITDDWRAKMWAQVLPKVTVREDIQLRPKTKMGWAIRKNSPKLMAELNEFHAYYAKQAGGIPALQRQYMSRIKALKNATASDDHKRYVQLIEVFNKYGKQYDFEPMMLAAQGYQESTLNRDAKSPVGAIGVMQVMPATGAELKVGDIHKAEPNIHAGAKYMDQLMTRYFQDAKFDEQNRTLFAFASYNAGPRQRLEDAQGDREARARPESVVQQCRDRHRREDRHRDHDLRAEHLQVPRGLQARGAIAGGCRESETAGCTSEEVGREQARGCLAESGLS
jgi:membrane-bound lytic murein transglycosylase MltF